MRHVPHWKPIVVDRWFVTAMTDMDDAPYWTMRMVPGGSFRETHNPSLAPCVSPGVCVELPTDDMSTCPSLCYAMQYTCIRLTHSAEIVFEDIIFNPFVEPLADPSLKPRIPICRS
jgi:hypothetical protein